METTPLLVAFAAMIPLMVYVMYTDLKYLRIPNWAVLAVFGVFVVTGLWGLPLESFLWRLFAGVVAFFLGFGLWAIGASKVGGGDMKLIAVLVPFVAASGVIFVLLTYALVSIAGIVFHRFIRAAILKGRTSGWLAFDQKIYLPVALFLGITILAYLGTEVADRLGPTV